MSEGLENSERLAKWLAGDLSEKESEDFQKDNELEDLKVVLEDISRWSLPPYDAQEGFKKFQQRTSASKKAKVISIQTFFRIAAVLVLGLSAYFTIDSLMDTTVQVSTVVGEQKTHRLPDGSVATLDANSTIAYDAEGWGEKRVLEMEGQVYFEVKSGSKFTVSSTNGVVEVLGTRFDVMSVNSGFVMNCFEGKVAVSGEFPSSIILGGEGFSYIDKEIRNYEVNEEGPAWNGEYVSYKEAPLSKVMVDLKRYFELSMDLPDQYLTYSFTGKVNKQNLEMALKSVFLPLEIQYTLEGKIVTFE